jgi:hypothetical protein
VGIEKERLPDPYLSQLNAAQYKVLLIESNSAIAERKLMDIKAEHAAAFAARIAVLKNIEDTFGRKVITWDPTSGDVTYAPAPQPDPPACDLSAALASQRD